VSGWRVGGRIAWTSGAILAALLARSSTMQAQQGLRSRSLQVALIARVPARGALQSIGPAREVATIGELKQASVSLRLSANSSCRLVVLRSAGSADKGHSRIWVRNAAGTFEELKPGSGVTVARDRVFAGEDEREVRYLFDTHGSEMMDATALPVRYEIRMDPVT
jgi:hypothetical protein